MKRLPLSLLFFALLNAPFMLGASVRAEETPPAPSQETREANAKANTQAEAPVASTIETAPSSGAQEKTARSERNATQQPAPAKRSSWRARAEEQFQKTLGAVGYDTPEVRAALQSFMVEESRARRPLRQTSLSLFHSLIKAQRAGVGTAPMGDPKTDTPPGGDPQTGVAQKPEYSKSPRSGAAPHRGYDGATAFGFAGGRVSSDDHAAPDDSFLSEKETSVLNRLPHEEKELRALITQLREQQKTAREARLRREAELDAKLNFSTKPRLEATLLLLGIIGESDSRFMLPPVQEAAAPASTQKKE